MVHDLVLEKGLVAKEKLEEILSVKLELLANISGLHKRKKILFHKFVMAKKGG